MKLFLVRHGETNWNIQNKLQSFSDIPLNEIGKKQVKKTADLLKNENFDLIYTSPLKRATETSQIINEYHKKEEIIHELLTERNYGKLEGSNYLKLKKNMEKIRDNDLYEELEIENPKKLKKRLEKFWEEIKKDNFGKKILLVSHSGAIKMLLSIIQNKDYEKIKSQIFKKNASVSIIEFDKDFNIINIKIGLDEHLK